MCEVGGTARYSVAGLEDVATSPNHQCSEYLKIRFQIFNPPPVSDCPVSLKVKQLPCNE